jgi:hypothetical protein
MRGSAAYTRPVRALLVLFAVALLSGCSGGDDEATPEGPPPPGPALTMSSERVGSSTYARRLNRLCEGVLAAHAEVGSSASPDELAADLTRTNVIDHRFVRDVGKLRPSKAEARRAARLLHLYAAMVDIQDSAYVHLKASGSTGYFQYMSTALEVRGKAERLARNLGAPACGIRPITR